MGVNEHFEPIFNAVWCQLRGFKTVSNRLLWSYRKYPGSVFGSCYITELGMSKGVKYVDVYVSLH
jgi:hypothetical protein